MLQVVRWLQVPGMWDQDTAGPRSRPPLLPSLPIPYTANLKQSKIKSRLCSGSTDCRAGICHQVAILLAARLGAWASGPARVGARPGEREVLWLPAEKGGGGEMELRGREGKGGKR